MERKSVLDEFERFALVELCWENYRKKCKHCNNYNTYRMKKIMIDDRHIDRFLKALHAAEQAFQKAYESD